MAYNLPTEKKVAVTHLLCEGNSIRSIERLTGIHRDTIMRLGVRMGQSCKSILDSKMRNLSCPQVQVDEVWGFIGAKKATVKQKNLSAEYGDVWTWIAIDADTKLVPSFTIGDRSKDMACAFMGDLASRVNGTIQITSDALSSYVGAVEQAFGASVDYGTVIKQYRHSDLDSPATRYSPPDVLRVKRKVVQGSPEWGRISTSFVEKQHHTLRMHCCRLSRLTNAFSKKLENFEAAIALHYAYYNFVKIHGSIGCTPAMAAGVESAQWMVADLVEMVEC